MAFEGNHIFNVFMPAHVAGEESRRKKRARDIAAEVLQAWSSSKAELQLSGKRS